jgi:hypothetical protein
MLMVWTKRYSQAFAVALGYKLRKIPFLVLAQRAKLLLLRD